MTVKDPVDVRVKAKTKEEARTHVGRLTVDLQELIARPEWDQHWLHEVHRRTAALHAYLVANAAMVGECRMATPYASINPIIDSQGHLIWCCEHDPSHCSK